MDWLHMVEWTHTFGVLEVAAWLARQYIYDLYLWSPRRPCTNSHMSGEEGGDCEALRVPYRGKSVGLGTGEVWPVAAIRS